MALLDSILKGRVLNVSYIILHHILSTPCIAKRSLPHGSIFTHILKQFWVPIIEPTFLNPKELGDKAIANLGFIWTEDKWCKNERYKNKGTTLAPIDHCFFNDVLPPNQLLDLNAP